MSTALQNAANVGLAIGKLDKSLTMRDKCVILASHLAIGKPNKKLIRIYIMVQRSYGYMIRSLSLGRNMQASGIVGCLAPAARYGSSQ